MSDITPQQVREALEYGPPSDNFDEVGTPNGFLQTVQLARQEFNAIVTFRDAARAWVDLYEECGMCFESKGYSADGHDPCPVCGGRGYVLNRERLEAAAKAIDVVIGIPDDGDDYELPLVRWNEAEAGVLAFLKEKQ